MPSRSYSAWLCSRSNRAREVIATVSVGAWPGTISHHELLGEDAFLEVVLGVEQQRHRALARLADGDLDDVAHLVRIGGHAHRSLVGIKHAEAHFGVGLQQRSAPATWAERRDRRQRDHARP